MLTKSLKRRLQSDLTSSLVTKLLTMVPAAVLGLLTTRVVIERYGTDGFAFYSLIISIPLILPFADFGMGGAVTELVSRREVVGYETVYSKIRSIRNVLLCIAGLVIASGWAIYAFGVWPAILGINSPATSLAAAITTTIFGIGIPLSLGYRVLLGLQLNRLVVLLQGLTGIVGALIVIPAAILSLPLWFIASIPALAALTMSLFGAKLASTRLGRSLPKRLAPGATHSGGTQIARLAIPLAVIAISTPISYQTDRVILSNFGDTRQVATYAAAFQLYAPLNAILVSGGQSLWPKFTGLRVSGVAGTLAMVARFSWMFGVAAVVAGLGLVVGGIFVTDWTTNGSAASGPLLLISFALLLTANAINYPFGMFMMSESGLAWQAIFACCMAVCKIPLAIILTPAYGAAGPVLASVIALVFVVVLPSIFWSKYDWRPEVDVYKNG